ncbi:hypothetical protein [Spirosoma arboris]|uniref:hypothetical protein n=1 Tax=Spirosoma arboris TaxID=2682092 RepID=UPI0018DDD09F|nr:hypothetical protein [Spirosoma arboris]
MINVLAMAVGGDPEAKELMTTHCNALTPVVAMHPEKPQLSVMRKEDPAMCQKALGLAIMRMTELINVTNTLTLDQADDLIARISGTYYYLRLDEILYVLEKGINGKYGRTFNTLDASVVMEWIEKYDVNERTQKAIELARSTQEEKTKSLSKEELAEFYKKAGIPNQNPFVDNSHIRTAKKVATADQDYRNFRAQYYQKMKEAQAQQTTEPIHEDNADPA